VKMESNREGKT